MSARSELIRFVTKNYEGTPYRIRVRVTSGRYDDEYYHPQIADLKVYDRQGNRLNYRIEADDYLPEYYRNKLAKGKELDQDDIEDIARDNYYDYTPPCGRQTDEPVEEVFNYYVPEGANL